MSSRRIPLVCTQWRGQRPTNRYLYLSLYLSGLKHNRMSVKRCFSSTKWELIYCYQLVYDPLGLKRSICRHFYSAWSPCVSVLMAQCKRWSPTVNRVLENCLSSVLYHECLRKFCQLPPKRKQSCFCLCVLSNSKYCSVWILNDVCSESLELMHEVHACFRVRFNNFLIVLMAPRLIVVVSGLSVRTTSL